jgi:hypothetical protein
MNHEVLAMAPIVAVAALTLTAVGFAIPQQVFAGYGHHYNHHNHHNHHNNNRIYVSQTNNQLNNCTTLALCDNEAQNQADIHR